MSSIGSIGSMSSTQDQNRGQNALQRRALQLKRWHELMAIEEAPPPSYSVPKVNFSSATLFLSSVSQNDCEECERLLRENNDLDVNATTGDGLTALHQMAIDDNLEMCRWLLLHDADVNCRDNEGWTPLHAAASCGHLEIVRLLLSREDCDVFAINCDGELARDVCDGDDCLKLIEDRMRRQLDVKCDDTEDDTIPENILQEIRNKELKQIEFDFHSFIASNRLLNEKLISQWIESTRDPTSGATVLHVCAAKGYNDILTTILETIGDRLSLDSLIDNDGFTALHSAAFWRQLSTFETLLKFGANFDVKTRDSRVVADLCHENPKIMELISETKKSRELQELSEKTTNQTTAETQRKLNAKRQRESRRPTQGVTKEDIEMALKNTSVSETPPPMPSSPPPVVSLSAPSVNCISTTVSVPLYPQRRRQKRRSTGIDSDFNAQEVSPSVDDSNEDNDCVDSQKTILSIMSSFGSWRSSSNPRALNRPSTSSSSSLSRSLTQLPFGSSSVSSQMPFITTAPSYQTTCATHRRQPHLNRRQSQPTSSAQNRLRGSTSQSTLSSLQNPLNALNSVFTTSNTSSVTTTPQSRSRSSSRSSLGQTTDDDKSDTTDDKRAVDEDSIDYKKLYKELLKENEFLIRKIKEIEIQRKNEKEFQDFQREKRQLLRRISELEEELKQKDELIKENSRLKDENSALIRVISKLSK